MTSYNILISMVVVILLLVSILFLADRLEDQDTAINDTTFENSTISETAVNSNEINVSSSGPVAISLEKPPFIE